MNEDADQSARRTNDILRALLEDDDDLDIKELAGPGDPPPDLLRRAIRAKEIYLGYKVKKVGKPFTNRLGETFVFGKFGSVMSTLLYYDNETGWQYAGQGGLPEGLDDEEDFKELHPEPLKYLPLGRVLPATGIEEDIIAAELELLASVNPEKAHYFREEWADYEDKAYLAYDWMPHELQKHCLPYTFFGTHEADGEWGVWVSQDSIDDDLEANPEKIKAVERGERLPKDCKYVAVNNVHGYTIALIDNETGSEVWHVNY